jgi:hypothetical protein
MKTGLLELMKRGARFFTAIGSNYVGIKPPATAPTASFDLTLFNALPGSTQAITVDSTGQLGTASMGGGGTLTSVAFAAPSEFSVSGSPLTGTGGTITLSKSSQSANLFFASPNGSSGVPTFRAVAWADVSGLVGSTSTSFAAGNDARFHTQNTDTGTTATSFQLNSGATGVRLKDVSGALNLRNSADSANANLIANDVTVNGNLTVSGTTTTINTATLAISDNIITLNSDVSTGTPTENAGVEVLRGSSSTTRLQWDETSDNWFAGTDTNLLKIARFTSVTFANGDLVAGSYTFTHNLNNQNAVVIVRDNAGKRIYPDDDTATSANVTTIDMTAYVGFSGNYTAIAVG